MDITLIIMPETWSNDFHSNLGNSRLSYARPFNLILRYTAYKPGWLDQLAICQFRTASNHWFAGKFNV